MEHLHVKLELVSLVNIHFYGYLSYFATSNQKFLSLKMLKKFFFKVVFTELSDKCLLQLETSDSIWKMKMMFVKRTKTKKKTILLYHQFFKTLLKEKKNSFYLKKKTKYKIFPYHKTDLFLLKYRNKIK